MNCCLAPWAAVATALLAASGAALSRECAQLTRFDPELPPPHNSRGYDTFSVVCDGTDVTCIANYDDSPDNSEPITWTCDAQTRSCLEDALKPRRGEELRVCPNVDACLPDPEARAQYSIPRRGARVPDLSRNGSISTQTGLDLGKCGIHALPAGWLRGASALEGVDVGRNRISKLVAGSFSGPLVQIQFFDNLVNLTVESEAFVNLPALRDLYLSASKVVSLAPRFVVNAPQLSILDLQQNHLQELPSDAFVGLRSLETLELSDNNLRTLPYDIFRDLSNLRVLSLQYNDIVQLPSGLLQPLTSLRTLRLTGNRIEVVSDFFVTGLPKLRYLNLDKNSIGTISPYAFHGVDLEKLELTQNFIRLAEKREQERSPFRWLKNLTLLALGDNSIRRLGRDFISDLPNLARLDLTRNGFTELNIEIAQFGPRRRDLTVDLSSNYIEGVSLADGEVERDPGDPSVRFALRDNPLRCDCALRAASRCAAPAPEQAGSCGVQLQLSDAQCREPPNARGQPPAAVFETLRCPPGRAEAVPQ